MCRELELYARRASSLRRLQMTHVIISADASWPRALGTALKYATPGAAAAPQGTVPTHPPSTTH